MTFGKSGKRANAQHLSLKADGVCDDPRLRSLLQSTRWGLLVLDSRKAKGSTSAWHIHSSPLTIRPPMCSVRAVFIIGVFAGGITLARNTWRQDVTLKRLGESHSTVLDCMRPSSRAIVEAHHRVCSTVGPVLIIILGWPLYRDHLGHCLINFSVAVPISVV